MNRPLELPGRGFDLLARMLVTSSLLIGLFGGYLKYGVIVPLKIEGYGSKSVMELPFLYFSDPVLGFLLEQGPQEVQKPDVTPTVPQRPSDPPTVTTTPEATKPDAVRLVDDSWFDHVLFIGDSRVEGLKSYARSGNADYFCDVGMQVFNVAGKQLSDRNFGKQSLHSLLEQKRYDKIFLCFGLNEAGYPTRSFQIRYQQLLDEILTLQPESVVILHGIMSVTEAKAGSADYFRPEHLQERNRFLESLADGKQIFYVDVNPWFADDENYLLESLTNDGCHPTVEGYRQWRDWIAYIAATLGV